MTRFTTPRILSILLAAPALASALAGSAVGLAHAHPGQAAACSLEICPASVLDLTYTLGEALPEAAAAQATIASLEVGAAGVMDLGFTPADR